MAHLDAQRRMLSYSGEGTTYRQEVRRISDVPDVAVEYSRPLPRGRTLLGALIPYDQVWRTGANAATHLSTTAPIRLAGVPLDSGSYTQWTLPTQGEVQLVINRETGQWGTGYQDRHDIARVAMEVDTLAAPVEQFTIRVDTASARLIMEWRMFRWSAPVEAAAQR